MTDKYFLLRAVGRARLGIWTMAATYGVSLAVGMAMVHGGNPFALGFRDRLVARAGRSDPAAMAYDRGTHVRAALLDFTRNVFLGGVPQTLGGVAVVVPYPVAAYRGWVGGIVSVDNHHQSRLRTWRQALYFLLTLLLQIIPYSLAGGAGVNLGWACFRPPLYYQGPRWHGIPTEALRDVLRIYALIVPLFFGASLWEFLVPWN